ncbi:MAG: T9SS type A sorting domain-containing protein [Bacteroidales bacterium]
MKKSIYTLLFLVLLTLPSFSQVNLNFEITLEKSPSSMAPAIHSYSYAVTSDGKWLILGGRMNGMHNFNIGDGASFPQAYENPLISVYDPVKDSVWNIRSAQYFPIEIADQMRATNQQFIQKGNYLYVLGGYGTFSHTMKSDSLNTFNRALVFSVDEFAEAVINQTDPSEYLLYGKSDLVKVTGGELFYFDDHFHLVGGQNFEGTYFYDPNEGIENYTDAIRIFDIDLKNSEDVVVTKVDEIINPSLLHRRDFNVIEEIGPNEEEQLALYSGVFQPGKLLSWPHPVYYRNNQLIHDEDYTQIYNVYNCPRIPIYDSENKEMTTVLFGGITYARYNPGGEPIIDSCEVGGYNNPCLPFSNYILAIQKNSEGKTSDTIFMRFTDNQKLGTNALFIPQKNIPKYKNGVLDLDKINEKTFIGYIYGGMDATLDSAYNVTYASKQVFKVYLKKKSDDLIYEIQTELYMDQPWPNPAAIDLNFRLPYSESDKDFVITLYSPSGQKVMHKIFNSLENEVAVNIQKLPPGVYIYTVRQGSKTTEGKVAILH